MCEVWPASEGASLTDTLANGDPRGAPAEVRAVPTFELSPAPDRPDVVAVAGSVRPPVTGDYRFMIAADDTALLLLDPDGDDQHHCRAVASVPSYTAPRDFTNFAAQTSRPVHLRAGRRYAVQAWMENAAGASHVSVGWTLPDGRTEAPIPADRLTPAAAADVRPPTFDVGPARVTLAADPRPAAAPGFHPLVAGAHCVVAGGPVDVSYALYLPDRFDTTADRRPLLVFLHGNTHQGTDLSGEMSEGVPHELAASADLRAAVPMVGLFPQLPDGWRWDSPGAPQIVNGLVRGICGRYPRVDRRRVYLTGLSMGGKGSWLTALDSPDLYAAVTTMSAVEVRPRTAGQRLATVPRVHIVCGGDDGGFTAGSRAMYADLKPSLGDRVELTVVPGQGHGVWADYYPDPAFYRDLMRYHR